MRLLANENIPGDTVAALRNEGHDITWIREESPGARDDDVLRRAQTQNRILLTFDKDFGELAFRAGLSPECGIILLRVSSSSPEHITDVTKAALKTQTNWSGHFATVEEARIRLRPLPR